jgi:hypothetical protein
MAEHPWNEHAIATLQSLDGLREIIKEGSLREVVQHIAALKLEVGGLRISLPDACLAPTSWRDQEIAALVRSYKLSHT